MNNDTISVASGDTYNLTAIVLVDGQRVYGYDLEFLLNGTKYPSKGLTNGTYYAPFDVNFKGDKLVNITNRGIKTDLTYIKTAMLIVKEKTILTISSKDISYGDVGLFEINLTDINGNKLNGTVTVNIDGNEYQITITDGIGFLNVTDLKIGNHVAKAYFPGDEIYSSAYADTTFNVTDNSNSTDVPIDDNPNNKQNGFSKTYESYNSVHNNGLAANKTGNPLILLVLALFALIYPIKSRK